MPSKRHFFPALLALLYLAALGLRLIHIDSASFWLDEVLQTKCASSPLGGIWQCYPFDKPPLDYYIQWSFMQFGDNEFLARLHAALIGAGFVVAMAWWGWLTGGRRVALLTAALSFALPYSIRYSQEVRPYALLMTSEVLFLALMTRVRWHRRVPTRMHWYALAAVMTIHLWSLFMAWKVVVVTWGFVLVGTLAGDRSHSMHRLFPTRALRLSLALAFAAAFGIGAIPLVRAGHYITPKSLPWDVVNVPREMVSYYKVLVGGYDRNQFTRLPALILFFPMAAGFASVISRHPTRRWVARLAVIAGAGGFVFAFAFSWYINHWMEVRYTLEVLPPLLLLMALGTDNLIRWATLAARIPHRKAPSLCRGLALAAALLYAAGTSGWVLANPVVRPDWRGIAKYLEAQHADGTVVVVGRAVPFEYYFRRFGVIAHPVAVSNLRDPAGEVRKPGKVNWVVVPPYDSSNSEFLARATWAPMAFEGLVLYRADDPTTAPPDLTAELRGRPLGREVRQLTIQASDPGQHLGRGWYPPQKSEGGTKVVPLAEEGELLFALTEPLAVNLRLHANSPGVECLVIIEINGREAFRRPLNQDSAMIEEKLAAKFFVPGLNRIALKVDPPTTKETPKQALLLELVELSVD